MRRPSILALTILMLASPVAAAADAFKCTAADGSVSFQDRPCGDASRQQRFRLPQYAPPPPAADESVVEAPPVQEPPPAPAPAVPREPPPNFFLCMRYDGSRYLSDSGIGDRYAIPYGMLAGSGRSLAQAYGGRGGIGVSAPGLRTPPTIPANEAPFATNYVQVEDECHRAAPQEACAYLRDELDRLQGKLRRAFSDTEAQLKQQQRELRARQRGC